MLVVVASKHGSTSAIATAVSDELRERGIAVSITAANDPDPSLDDYDAAVIGSAIYVGHWMKGARNFLQAHGEQLRGMPLWLFSSGPLGDGSAPPDELADIRALAVGLHVRDHRIFAGNLDKADLNLAERAAVRMVHAPYGDFRDWDEIRSWAKTISEELANEPTSASVK